MNAWIPVAAALGGVVLGFVGTLVSEGQKERWTRARESRYRQEARADRLRALREEALLELQGQLPLILHARQELGILEVDLVLAERDGRDTSAHSWRQTEVAREHLAASSRVRALLPRVNESVLDAAVNGYFEAVNEFGAVEARRRDRARRHGDSDFLTRSTAEQRAIARLDIAQAVISELLLRPK